MSSVILFIYLVDWEGASKNSHMVRPRVSYFLARGDFHAHSRVRIPPGVLFSLIDYLKPWPTAGHLVTSNILTVLWFSYKFVYLGQTSAKTLGPGYGFLFLEKFCAEHERASLLRGLATPSSLGKDCVRGQRGTVAKDRIPNICKV